MSTTPPVKRRRRRSSSAGGWMLIIGVLLIAMFCGFIMESMAQTNSERRGFDEIVSSFFPQVTHQVKKIVYNVENVNLESRSKEAQRTVDEMLLQQKDWQLSDDGRKDRKQQRLDKKGEVLWNMRTLLVGIPHNEKIKVASSLIKDRLNNTNLVVVEENEITYVDDEAIALYVGIREKAGENLVTCITDKIIIFNGDQTSYKSMTLEKAKMLRLTDVTELKGKIAIVIDDCGDDMESLKKMTSLPIDMTYSILPFKAKSAEALNLITKSGHVAMLHLPMEPINKSKTSEPKSILVSMSKNEAAALTKEAILSLPGIKGVNNHQGSMATANTQLMRAVLQEVKNNKLFFLDSHTNSKSVADKVAGELKIKTGRNEKFMDNSSDVDEIKKQLWVSAHIADKDGYTIIIGHARPNTAKAIAECYPELKKIGICFVSVDKVLK